MSPGISNLHKKCLPSGFTRSVNEDPGKHLSMKYPIRTEQQILIYVTMDLEEKRETRHGDTCFLAAIFLGVGGMTTDNYLLDHIWYSSSIRKADPRRTNCIIRERLWQKAHLVEKERQERKEQFIYSTCMMNQLHSKEILWIGGLRSYEPYCGSAINEPLLREWIDWSG